MVEARAPYGRRPGQPAGPRAGERGDGRGAALPAYEGQTYYGLPAIKKSHYRWLIASYFFVGGMAGAAQVIATVADLLGSERDRPVVRNGRYVALVGALASPLLLVKDLQTPSRWYNMLRIFRATSPMSSGSWTLAIFGAFSGLTALGQLLDDLTGGVGRGFTRFFGLPAALAGALMSLYTGVLLAATSVPLWAVGYRHLPPLFAASAIATATAALSLLLPSSARRTAGRRLERLALVASGAQLALGLAAERRWKQAGVAGPLEAGPLATAHRLGALGLGTIAPLVVHAVQLLTGRRSARLARLAALATLVGGFVERAVIVFAGNASALRPQDYFRIAQSDTMPSGDGAAAGLSAGTVEGGRR